MMTVGDIRQVVEEAYHDFDIGYIDSLPVFLHVNEDGREVAYHVKSAEVFPSETFVIHLGERIT